MRRWMAAALAVGPLVAAAEPAAVVPLAEQAGRVEAKFNDSVIFAWQSAPLSQPTGGEKFAASAFLHPLRTPSGFEWTTIQPADHLHHLGLWWPWKYIEVDGAKFNCWEIQEGQGAHVARSVKPAPGNKPEWDFLNEMVIKKSGAAPLAVIQETARVSVTVDGDSQIIDISLRQKATGSPVTIVKHHYSGFSWRGPPSWNKDNSTLTSSAGEGRDHANGTPAKWVVVSGPTPKGSASVLMMSAATDLAGAPEKIRIWDSKAQNGAPFVNFNPVMDASLPLDDVHPAVSNRKYRVIAADHVIDAAAAESAWRKWLGK